MAAPEDSSVDAIAPWRAMLIAHSRAVRAIEAHMTAEGVIALTWYDVLLELHGADGPLQMRELGNRVVLSRTRVSRLVQELEAHGLVKRTPNSGDGRSTLASITAAGTEELKKAAPVYLAGIEQHFTDHLTPSQREAVTTGLGRVADAHGR